MLTYISRRVALLDPGPAHRVVPAVLWSCAQTFDPCAQLRTTPGGAASVERCRTDARARRPDRRRSTATGSATPCRATSGRASRPTRDVSDDDQPRALAHGAADLLGHPRVARCSSIALGIYSALKQYSVGDYVVHRRCRSSASRCRRSGSGSSRSSSSSVGPKDVVRPRRADLLLRRPAQRRTDRVQPRLPPPPRAAGA